MPNPNFNRDAADSKLQQLKAELVQVINKLALIAGELEKIRQNL